MTEPDADQARYPLRAVMRRTGLSADVLRAWERRYGAIRPQRSAGGQRLYSETDVGRLVLLQRATAAGHAISEIARLDHDALEALVDGRGHARSPRAQSALDAVLRDAMAATEGLDAAALEAALKRCTLSVGTDAFVDDVLPRFLRTIGDRWHRGAITPAHEHLATHTAHRVLDWIIDAFNAPPNAPRLLVATPASEMHELGALLVAAAAASESWHVLYLGANLPAADIVAAAVQVRARMVALSIVYADGDTALRELRETAAGLPPEILVVMGGMAAARLERSLATPRIRLLPDLESFRTTLRKHLEGTDAVAAD